MADSWTVFVVGHGHRVYNFGFNLLVSAERIGPEGGGFEFEQQGDDVVNFYLKKWESDFEIW